MKPADTKALAEIYADYRFKPLHHVMFEYPWMTDKSIQACYFGGPDPNNKWRTMIREETGTDYLYGPDEWACEFLYDWGVDMADRGFDGMTPVRPLQYATVSGHGIGKSALTAWIGRFIMTTRPLAQGKYTAGAEQQLKGRTWMELGKWHGRALSREWFDYTAGRGSMHYHHKQYGGEWKCEGQSCREENAQNFAGQHAVTSTSFYVMDEASEVPDKVYEVRHYGLTDGEPMTFDFGNMVINSGEFYEECFGRLKNRMARVRSIDSRDVQITSKAFLEDELAAVNGDEDHDRFRVRVRGLPARQSSTQFISGAKTKIAMARDDISQRVLKNEPLVIGVDVARHGDDESVIWPRIGNDARSWEPVRYRGFDTTWVIGEIINMIRDFRNLGKECSGLFIDGGNTGGAIVDQLRSLGYSPIEVKFGSSAHDKVVYRYVMDEIWGKLRDAINSELRLPSYDSGLGQDLYDQLTQRQYYYITERIALESKKEMRKRSVASPDLVDALACTYYLEVENLDMDPSLRPTKEQNGWDYDPYADRRSGLDY